MNTLTTLPINSADTPTLRSVLHKEGFSGNVIDLVPGAGFPEQDHALDHEQFLFVIQGEVTVSEGDVNTVLGREQALLLPKGRNYSLVVSSSGPAKVLRLDIPARQVITPPLETVKR